MYKFSTKKHVPVWTKSCSQKGRADRQTYRVKPINPPNFLLREGGRLGENKIMYWVSKRPVAISSKSAWIILQPGDFYCTSANKNNDQTKEVEGYRGRAVTFNKVCYSAEVRLNEQLIKSDTK